MKTIQNSQPPTSVSVVRSFLGMIQYVASFIPGFANITEPLRRLTKKETEWKWEAEEQQAFDRLKQELTGTQIMAYFDPQKPTDVIVDASPVGLGAILAQQGKIISYASRALTDVEQRYSQTDREFLAIVYGVEHFHLYLFGSKFTVPTDLKPLLGIISKSKPATARIECLHLRLMPYEFELQYRPGRDEPNPADYLCRYSELSKPTRDNASEVYVHYVCKNTIPKSIKLDEVHAATQQDPTLQKLMTTIQTGRWHESDQSDFTNFKDELSVVDGVILRDHHLVIPKYFTGKSLI